MTICITRRLALAGLAATTALGAPLAWAQAYPTKPVRLVVPYAAGGGTDAFARTVAPKLAEDLGQQVIVENKPGASTMIGADLVAKSAADGYNVLLGDNATYAVNQSLFKRLPYSPADLEPVTLTARFALLLVVPAPLGVNSVKELVALATTKPGTLSYGSPGAGSPHHLAMEMLRQRAGIEVSHVPYKGAAPAAQDLLGGTLSLMFLDLASAGPHVKSGRLKALAVSAAQRLPGWPDLPTVAESGYPGFEAHAWQGFSVPAGTPESVVRRLNASYAKAAADPAVKQRMQDLGGELTPSTSAAMGNHIKSEAVKWARVVKEANITLD